MSKRRAGTGGVTAPPPTPAVARVVALKVTSSTIRLLGQDTGPEACTDAREVLGALGLTLLARRTAPQPLPEPAATPAPPRRAATPGEPLPDVLTPRAAAAVARAAHRARQPVPERAARVLNHHRRTNRTQATP